MLDATTTGGSKAPEMHGSSANSSAPHAVLRQWCVAYTEPQAERWADQNLRQLGYQTCLLMVAVQRRDNAIRSLLHTVKVPLFPRYLFVANAEASLWRPIREAPGVQSVITCGGKVQYARLGAVEALEAVQALAAPTLAGRSVVAAGKAYRVRHGVAQGFRCMVLAVKRDQARVAMVMLGQLRDVWLPIGSLDPVDPDA